MPIGQSALAAVMVSGMVKRLTYLTARAQGASPREADFRSDEYAISAATSFGTTMTILTVDPIGGAGVAAYCALLEADLAKKREASK